MKFMETSAKANEGVEEAFFTLARFVALCCICGVNSNSRLYRDCKTRLIDSQADSAASVGGASNADGSVKVNQPATSASIGCCS